MSGIAISVNAQTTYTWTGATNTAWATITNWSPNGNPGSVAGDVVIIPTNANANAPVLTVAPANPLASITFTTTTTRTLTITGATLNVTGAVTLNSATAAAATTIAGTGTLNCGSVVVGSTVTPSASVTTILSSTISNLNVSGNVTLNSFNNSTFNNNATFTHTSGTVSITGQISTSNAVAGNTSTYTMGNSSPTLNLSFGGNPFNPSATGTSTFTLNGTGSVVNYNGNIAQTIRAATYSTLKVNNTAGAILAGATTITTLTIGDVTANSVFNDGGQTISTATTLNMNTNACTYNCTAATFPWGTLNAGTTGTVNYLLTGSQTVRQGLTYFNLGISGGSSSVKTLGAGNITVTGTLTIAASTSLTYPTTARTITLSGTGANTLVNNGIIDMSTSNVAHVLQLAASGIAAFGTLTTGTGSRVQYTGGSAGQTINSSVTYNNLQISTTTGTNTAGGNLTINGALTTDASTTLDMGANTLSVNGTPTNNGTILTQNTSSTPIPSGKTWAGTINYNGSSSQTIVTGTYSTLKVNNTAGATLAGATTITILTIGDVTANSVFNDGGQTISTATTLNMNTNACTYNCTASAFPSWTTFNVGTTGTVNFGGTGNQTIPARNFYNLTISGSSTRTVTLASSGTIGVSNIFNPLATNVTYTTSGSTISFNNASGGQSIPAFNGATGYNNLTMSNTSGTQSAGGNLMVNGRLTTTAGGTFTDGGFTLDVNGDVTLNGTHNSTGSGEILLSGSSAQTITGTGSFANLEINNAAGISLVTNVASCTVSGTLTFTSGNLTINTNTLTLSGTVTGSGGTLTGSATSNLTIGGAGTLGTLNFTSGSQLLNNLTIGRITSGTATLGTNLSLAGTLTLTNGIINTGSNLITITSTLSASVSGGSTTSFVNGRLARTFPASLATGSTYIFPIGKGSYNVMELINPTTSAAGTVILTAEVFDIAPGGSNGSFFVANTPGRYWSMVRSGAGALTAFGAVRLTDASVSLGRVVGYATSQTGAYASYGGTFSGSAVATINALPTSNTSNFFQLGDNTCLGVSSSTTTLNVGPSGPYAKLTDVANALNAALICGNLIFEFEPTYDGSTGEVFPIQFNALNYSGGPWNVTIRPSASVSSTLNISGNSSTQLIDLNGADNLTIDGRPGGTGTNKFLTVSNTSPSGGNTFQLINDASNNTLRNLTIRGINATFASGTILLSTGSSTGNNNNTITNCNIDSGTGNSVQGTGIYSNGSALVPNSSNTITNNNIFNFRYFGIRVTNTGNGGSWNISGNNFYYNSTVVADATSSLYSIYFVPGINANSNNISDNTIGGQDSNNPWIFPNTIPAFYGIYVEVGDNIPTTINGNKIQYISWPDQNVQGDLFNFYGIQVNSGLVNIGSSSGNVVQSISVTSGQVKLYGISLTSSSAGCSIANNSVNQIQTGHEGSNHQIFGIYSKATGIGTPLSIINNTIEDLTSVQDLGNCQMVGIMHLSPSHAVPLTVTGNTVRRLTTGASGTGTGGGDNPAGFPISSRGAPLMGITLTTAAGGNTIGMNTVHTLKNNAYSDGVVIHGIFYSGATSGSNKIERNFIHTLYNRQTLTTASPTTGIWIAAGNTDVQNNMIRLGLDELGVSCAQANVLYGINELAGTSNYYHNSVYIGGTGVANNGSGVSTFAFRSVVGTGTRAIQNNIFYNARSNNTTAGGKHYAISIGGTTTIGLTSNYNDLISNGTNGGVLGLFNATDRTTFSAWQTATSRDANSINVVPAFITPNGTNTTIDLHINSATGSALDGVGTPVAGVTDDYDAELRSSTAPDIGADEFCSSNPSTTATIGSYTNNVAPGTSLTVNWTRGNGAGVIVVGRLTSSANVAPVSGTTYTANAVFGSGTGTAITGTGNFVVYSGTGTSVNVTGLTTATSYTFTVYEYNSPSCYAAGSSSSVTTLGGATIILANNGTQPTAANVAAGTSNVVLHKSSLAVTLANATLTGMTCTTSGNYQTTDLTNLKVWYSADATLDGGDAVLSTYTSVPAAGSLTFPSFTSQVINSGLTGYIFITADIACGVSASRTISVSALTTSDFTFSSGTKSGSSTAGGIQTITVSPTAPTGAASQSFCSTASPTVASLVANGTAILWYDEATNGTLLASGTALVNGTSYYATQTESGCESITRLAVAVTVNSANTVGTASSTPTLCINTALTNITHTTTVATSISDPGVSGANGLPAGVSAIWASNTITISGTPTASGTFNYSIPLTAGCGSANATGTITVNANLSAVSLAPSTTQNINVSGTGTQLTAGETGGSTITSRQWGWRSTSGGTITSISGQTSTTYTPAATDLNSNTPGTYYVVCTSTPTCGSTTVSNEVTVTIMSPTGPYYWVGGTAASDVNAANVWSTSLGGAPIPSHTPSSVNSYIVDGTDISSAANAQTGTVTLALATDATMGTLEIKGNANVVIKGDLTSSTTKYLTIDGLSGTDDLIIGTGSTLSLGTNGTNETAGVKVSTGNTTIVNSGTFNVNSSATGYGVLELIGNSSYSGTAPIYSGTNAKLVYSGVVARITGTEFPSSMPGSLVINHIGSGADGIVTLNGNRTVLGAITLTSGILDIGPNTLTVAGNSVSRTSGVIDADAGTMAFANTSSLVLPSGVFAGDVNNLTMNGSGGVTLGSATTVSSTLTLTNGKLNIANHNVTVNGSISGGDASSFVQTSGTGALIRSISGNGTYTFPVGEPTYAPMVLTLNSGTYSTALIAVFTKNSKIPGLNIAHTSYLKRYWSVEPSGITSPNYNISYNYNDADLENVSALQIPNLVPVKKSGVQWYKPAGTTFLDGVLAGTGHNSNVSNRELSWNGLTSFSLFGGTLSSGAALPIELVSFTAECNEDRSRLFQWQTASEYNNDYFIIEASANGKQWNTLAKIDGAGNSSQVLNYSYRYKPEGINMVALNYYRLKHSDYDGATVNLGIISLSCNFDWMCYFVNPVEDKTITGVIVSLVEAIADIQVISPSGQMVAQENRLLKKGSNLIELVNVSLSSGAYMVRVTVADQLFVHKLVVLK